MAFFILLFIPKSYKFYFIKEVYIDRWDTLHISNQIVNITIVAIMQFIIPLS